ncbi:MAG: methyltransferase domain-containing protein [Candidatus Heimdallarchaeota archaeon]|nr:methyltransferase domain-containing protein [Candidatus Heimdallarchaeota archaeon]
MERDGSYHIEDWDIDGKVNTEIKRLKHQLALTLDKELIIWNHLGLSDGMKIYEPGPGPGFLTKELVAIYPNSSITCVEVDPKMIEIFNTVVTKAEQKNVELINKSVTETDLQDDTFDFVIVRALLQHVPDLDAALRDLHRVLKPGGIIYILDRDDALEGIMEPKLELSNALSEKMTKLQEDRGGHPNLSRHLPRKLKALNFTNVDFHLISFHSEIIGNQMFKNNNTPESFTPMVKAGFVTKEQVEDLIEEGNDWMNNPEAIFIGIGCVIVGIKS